MANEIARSLRKRMTRHEVKLWLALRGFNGESHHFRRQVPIGPYIVDFAEKTAHLVIEVDGSQHGGASHSLADDARDRYLRNKGYRVMRFWNIDVDQALDGILTRIMEAISLPHPSASRPPSPHGGEG